MTLRGEERGGNLGGDVNSARLPPVFSYKVGESLRPPSCSLKQAANSRPEELRRNLPNAQLGRTKISLLRSLHRLSHQHQFIVIDP